MFNLNPGSGQQLQGQALIDAISQIGQGGFIPQAPGQQVDFSNILEGVQGAGAGAGAPAGIMDQLKQFMLGKTNNDGTKEGGWGGLALNAGMGLANTWMGMKQYGLAKDSLKENKRQFDLNYGAQRNMTNSQLSDRQDARMSATRGNGTQDTASYMKQWGV